MSAKETHHAHSTETPTKEPISTEHQSPSLNKEQPESSKDKKTNASDSKSSSCSETFKPFENYMPITKRYIDDFHRTTFRQYENTDDALKNYQQIITFFKTDHNTRIRRILDNLQEVQNAVKEDLALNKKVLKVAEAYTKNSTNLTELLTLVKNFDFPGLKTTIDSLKADVTTQNDHLAKWAESSASMAWSVGPRMTRIENTQGNIKSDLASLKNVKTRRGTAGAVSQKAPICKVVSTGKQYSEGKVYEKGV
ncbi:hypothetical protein Tco_0461257 [Tanacetum coccineum]